MILYIKKEIKLTILYIQFQSNQFRTIFEISRLIIKPISLI